MDDINTALIRTLSNDEFMELFKFMCSEKLEREVEMKRQAKEEINNLLYKIDDLRKKYNFELGYNYILDDDDNVDPLDIFIR